MEGWRSAWAKGMVIGLLAATAGMFGVFTCPALAEINPTDEDIAVSPLAGNAQPDPFTGAMTFQVPLQVLPGRRGLQPTLTLVYRSSQANDWVGVGWKLELGKIECKRSGPNGELTPGDYAGNRFLYRLNGMTRELVPIPGGDGTEYRARFEGEFMRFRRLANPADGNRPYWEVTDRLGTKYLFGQTSGSRLVEPIDHQDKIFEWLLDRVQDVHGNYFTAAYDLSLPGLAYPAEILYTGHNPTFVGPSDPGTMLKAPTNSIAFVLDAQSNPVHTKFPNYNVVAGKRLRAVVMKANTNVLVRAYQFTYALEPIRPGESTRSLLQSVQQIGKPTGVDAAGNILGGLTAPAWTFTYGDVSAGLENVLTAVSNGVGGTIQAAYTEGTAGANQAFRFAKVASVAVADGTGALPSTTTYQYAQPAYDLPSREFRGFATTIVTGPVGPGGEQRVTQQWFHQGNDTGLDQNDPTVAEAYTKGKPYRIQVKDEQGRLLSETTIVYQADEDGLPPYFTPQADVRGTICDGTACTKETRTVFAYDAYGNIVREDQYGDASAGNSVTTDDRTITRVFRPNVSNWIVGLPSSETVAAGIPAGPQMAATFYCYDMDRNLECTASTVQSPSKGLLTHHMRWTSGDGGLTTRRTYDGYGNVVMHHEPWNGSYGFLGEPATFDYDPTGTFVIKTHHPELEGGATVIRYLTGHEYYGVNGVPMDTGLFGQLKRRSGLHTEGVYFYLIDRQYDALGRVVRDAQPDGGVTTLSYVSFGTVGQQHVLRQHSIGLASRTYFDGLGRSVRQEESWPTGQTLIAQVQYDARGAVNRQSLPGFDGETTRWRTFSYDALGRMTQAVEPDGSRTLRCEDDWSVTTVDANGHQRRETRDAFGRLIAVDEFAGTAPACRVDPGGGFLRTTYQYDALGNLRFATDAQGNVTERRYDILSRVTFFHDPDMGNRTYTYNSAGLLDTETDASGKQVLHVYDKWGREGSKSFNSPINTSASGYIYARDVGLGGGFENTMGRIKYVDGAGLRIDFGYDPLGRVTRMRHDIKGSDKSNLYFTYDTLGRLTSVKYPDNSVVRYDYSGPWLTRVYEGAVTYAAFSDQTAAAQPRRIEYGNGAVTTLAYHEQNRRVLGRQATAGGGTIQNFGYNYDPAGNLTTITDPLNGNQTFAYDERNRLINATGPYGELTFAYDAIGNLTFNSLVGAYTYPPSGPSSVQPHAATQAGSATYSYDGTGLMTSVAGPISRTFTYDHEHRPLSIMTNGTITTMEYDAFGTRGRKTVGTTKTEYRSHYYECEKIGKTTSCVKIIWAGSLRVAMKQVGNETVTYFHQDHLGSASVVTNASGTVDQRITYYPFGRTRSQTDGSGAPISPGVAYKYTDQELDASTGLYYYKARYYDPILSRFIQPDTVVPNMSDPQSLNRYNYVLNNPLRYADPTGHKEEIPNSQDWSIANGLFSPDQGSLVGYTYRKVDTDSRLGEWKLTGTGATVITKYNTINGIDNSPEDAQIRAIWQVSEVDPKATSFTNWYNSSEGFFLDLLESAALKSGFTLKIAKEVGRLLSSNPESVWVLHSEGALIFNAAVSWVHDNKPDLSLNRVSAVYNGAPVNHWLTERALNQAGVTMRGWNGNPGDFVHDVIGLNTLNPFRWAGSILLIPTLWLPQASPHCCYGATSPSAEE